MDDGEALKEKLPYHHHEWDIMDKNVKKGSVVVDSIKFCGAIEKIPRLIYEYEESSFSDSDE